MTLSLELSQIKDFNVNKKPVNFIENTDNYNKKNKKMNKDKKSFKKSKWRSVTSELAMFNVKPEVLVTVDEKGNEDIKETNENESSVQETTTSNEICAIDYELNFKIDDILHNNDEFCNEDEQILDSLYNVNKLAYYKYLNQYNMNYKEIKQSALQNSNQLRAKKSNKRIKIKTAIRTNSFLAQINFNIYNNNENIDLLKNIKFSSFYKSKSKLYIKYNIYIKLFIDDSYNGKVNILDQFHVGIMNRANYIFARNKSINSNTDFEELKARAKNYLAALTPVSKNNSSQQKQQQQQQDIPALNVFTIDHNRVNNEITENYDQLYVEFLISLQHREITPEDYEYLTRLDELVKKKTISENNLNKLKCETVTNDNIDKFSNDLCAICMDPYLIDQIRKHLPCGHVFHNTCIDAWLSSNSTKCPLDQLSIENNGSFSRSISIMSNAFS